MDKCPEKEILEKFLNYELTEEMNDNIFSHLQLCDNCKHTVKCLLSDEKNLLQSLLKEPVFSKNKQLPPTEKCLSKVAILAYADECLDKNQLKLVESHLENCDNCLNELIGFQKTMALPTEVELDMSALKATKKELARAGIDILEIMLKTKDNFLDLINHTGELVNLKPQLGTVRGKEIEAGESILIRKDFKDMDLSIEVTLNKEFDKSKKNLRISVMKLSTEEFLPGVGISLVSMGEQQLGETNKEGIVEFRVNKKGKYGIKISEDRIALIAIQ